MFLVARVCCLPSDLSNSEKIEAVHMHNVLRNKLGSKDKKGYKMVNDTAVNMMKLKWSDLLEASSQQVADQCKKIHLEQTDELSLEAIEEFNGPLGENLYMAGGHTASVGQMVKDWYKEVNLDRWKQWKCSSE